MRYIVSFVPEAEEDLFQIYRYVYFNDSEVNAEKLFSRLYEKCLLLEKIPDRGRIPSELGLLDVNDFLEIHYKPYRIIYRVMKNEVFIHCIIDGRRDLQKLLQERLLR